MFENIRKLGKKLIKKKKSFTKIFNEKENFSKVNFNKNVSFKK